MALQQFEVSLSGGDSVRVDADIENGQIRSTQWSVTGRLELLEAAQALKSKLVGQVSQLAVPQGHSPAALILKQLVLQMKGLWPTELDPELCHCRKVPRENVARAIILGAHTVEKVRQRSSANTSCGTCLPDVEDILDLYLK